MSLGASPLTAYFSPSSSSAKRKEPPIAPTRKSKNPRNDDLPADSSGPQKGKATKKQKQDLEQHGLPFIPKAPQGTSSDPSTPGVGDRRDYTALQTPPASVEVSGRTKSKPAARPVRSPSPSNNTLPMQGASHLPTPSTKPRPKTRATVNSLPVAAETPCKFAMSVPPTSNHPSLLSQKTSPAVFPSDPSIIVPSSQSQPELMEALPDKNPPRSVTEYPEEPEEESPELARFEEYSHEDAADMTVASSQSQFLVPFKLSPRKKRRNKTSLVISTRQTEVYDIVPSSQSYERELQIPKTPEDSLPLENPTPRQ
jgi:hypothetical protein